MKIKLLVVLFFVCHFLVAQDWHRTRNQFIFSNISINGIIGGTGALVNKKRHEKPLRVFLKGFGQGCLGGTFQVLGKGLTYNIGAQQNLSYAWPARITNAIGASITQNAANNINFWEEWHMNLGIVRLDYSVSKNEFRSRVIPSSIFGLISVGRQGKLDMLNSIQTGTLVFKSKENLAFLGQRAPAIAQVSSIGIKNNIKGEDFYHLMAHETMHILQYDNMVYLNPFFKKLDRKWKDQYRSYDNLSKYIYFDLNGVTLLGAYLTQLNKPWECRVIEREADFYSTWTVWPRCQ